MELTINVTQEHIDKGLKGQCDLCPIALAVTQALTDNGIKFQSVVVFSNSLTINFRKLVQIEDISLRLKARNFIRDFDTGYKVEPFSFVIEAEIN